MTVDGSPPKVVTATDGAKPVVVLDDESRLQSTKRLPVVDVKPVMKPVSSVPHPPGPIPALEPP